MFLSPADYAHATEESNQEQVIVSPAQQAVNTALATATTEVQQAITATNNTTIAITQAQTEIIQAQTVVSEIASTITNAQAAVSNIESAINTINNIDLVANPIDQSSQTVQDAKDTVTIATAALNTLGTKITEAQTEVSQATTARSTAVSLQTASQTELTQANIAIDNAQTAVNNLQATIGTSTNVLAGVDDAGVQMNLPFGLLMGGTLYNNIFVGSNATITFGINEGWVYYQTPNAPSVSIAGWDWTTWSTGTGITYSTTESTLDIAWDVRPFPQTDASTQMVQIRFNADVNPVNGAWRADVSAVGPIPEQARFNYRETAGGAITQITDTNTGSGFNGQIGQGPTFTPLVNPNTQAVQAAVDAANATIFQLNSSLSPVVSQRAINQSAINALPNTISLTSAVSSAIITKSNLESTLTTNSNNLTSAINNTIPTPAPILDEPVIEGTTVTIAPELPSGYTANTWFYQVISVDPNAENPYEGQTLNTDGAPSSIQLTGLTEGATYIIRVANWSGPTSQYTETTVSIPAAQSSNLISGGSNVNIDEQTPPNDTTPVEPDPVDPVVPEPVDPVDPTDETPSRDDEPQDTDTPKSDEPSSNDGQDNNPEESQGTDNNSQNNDTITIEDIQNAVEEFLNDGTLTLEEKSQIADLLVEAAGGEPVSAADIAAAGLEFRDLPPATPVEVRTDINGNPVVITAEVASALLTLENPAAFIGGIAACINPDEQIEGLTEEQKCELFKALANIGADMSPQERQNAKEVLVAAILVGQVILGSSILRIRG